MENETPQVQAETPAPQPELIIDKPIAIYLMESCKWGKFLSIIGFVSVGFMVILGFGVMAMFSAFMPEMPQNAALPFGGGFLGTIYLLMALLYFFPTLYLYRFSTKTKAALQNMSQDAMTEAFLNLKSMFKFMGVFMAVILGFYALMILGVGVGSVIGTLS